MYKIIISVMVAASLSQLALANSSDCEDTVDMADSLDFHKMHIECNNDPVVIYDPNSKSSFLTKKKEVVDTYHGSKKVNAVATQTLTAVSSVPVDAAPATTPSQDNAGVIFNIREPFTITGGPQSALNGLYVQMANYCPAGWEKVKEWSEPNQGGYYLHYQFQCAE
ncbi:MAG: hypothetical protein CL693_16715 [Cellvibrionaceae bacterium]|nr:hypothetical protein [Cellvibrionaceae bacterium]|tara:strand:- start:29241 stop:29738 length:498 start_codon:yes stop_codon:yes gene_type:complete